MEYSKNFNFALPSSANDTDLADITEIANNFRKIDEKATKKDDFQKIQNEVVDARKDFVGRENKSVGESIRNQFGELFEVIGTGKNLFNPNDPDIVVEKIFNDNGELSISNTAYMTSGYIPVDEGKTYISTVKKNDAVAKVLRSYALYDTDKNFVRGSGTASNTGKITIPTGKSIKYIRFSTYSASYGGSEWQFEKNGATEYEPYHLLYALNDTIVKSSLKMPIENNEALIKTSASLNLINTNDLLVDKKYKDTDGTLETASKFSSTNPIEICGYDKIVIQQNMNVENPRAIVFYDKDLNIVAHYSTVPKEGGAESYPDTVWRSVMTENGSVCIIPIPNNAYYFALSVPSDRVPSLMVYGVKGENVIPLSTPYQEYVETYRTKQSVLPIERYIKSYFNGKKLVAIGDSITYGTGLLGTEIPWAKQVASMLNMTFVNYGIGGSEIALNKANSPYNPMCVRYAEMDDDADLIIVAGGTNDWGHITGNVSIAENEYLMGKFGDTEITTFYGALDTMCRGLLTKYVGKTVFFMTPIKRYSASTYPYYTKNKRGYTLEDYANAIKKVCGFYGIPVLDMFNGCSLNPIIEAIKTAYITDGTHPNFAGHRIMARQVAGYISSLKNDIDYN